MDEAELLKRLMVAFKEEAKEHTNTIATGLIELEKNPGEDTKTKIHEQIYRAAHSMKGAARAVSLSQIEKIFQSFEGCLSLMKSGDLKPTPAVFDVFHSVIKLVELLLDDNKTAPEPETINEYIELLNDIEAGEDISGDIKNLSSVLINNEDNVEPETKTETESIHEKESEQEAEPEQNQTLNETAEEAKPKEKTKQPVRSVEKTSSQPPEVKKPEIEPQAAKSTQDIIRLSAKKIDEIYLLAEESLQLKLSHEQEKKEIHDVAEDYAIIKDKFNEVFSSVIKCTTNPAEKTVPKDSFNSESKDIAARMEVIQEQIKNLDKKLFQLNQTSRFVSNSMHNILDNLVDEVKNILMLPFSNLFDSFPRIVRELSKDLKKEIDFDITGADIEVDRRIMEELKDPLIHIIRNCIDHGIEKPEERVAASKNKRGSIQINVVHSDANHVQIEIIDDGAGISIEKVKKKAISSGITSKEKIEQLSENEIQNFIFKSGISTSSIITDISGRGLGLAIVEENVEKLGGKVQLQSEPKKGTKFTITVPTTVSKARGIVVKVNNKPFIFPASGIVETLRLPKDKIKFVENKSIIQFREKSMPLVYLAEILQTGVQSESNKSHIDVAIVESLNQRIGFVVDSLENEQEVLFKKTGFPLIKIRNISGVSLLGTGEICPVLNNQELIKSALQSTVSTPSQQKSDDKSKKQKSIIMAEDSITSRLFLKNILEGAGYKVKATIDGKEAFTALKQEKFDLLVSDVEMPRMDGFELTEAVRNDQTLKELPVVLVTSLGKREDQERGIDVGANAYIVKSSFEQSNLLEVIERLI